MSKTNITALDEPPRDQIALGFKETKRYLAYSNTDPKSNHICFALATAYRYHKLTHRVWMACRSIIRIRLQGHVVYNTWVEAHGISFEEIQEDQFNNGILCQAGRHAWLDSLICEYSK